MTGHDGFRAVLLDVEGTTSAISYVYRVMFPYAAEHSAAYLQKHGHEPAARAACTQMARDAGLAAPADTAGADPIDWALKEAHRLMMEDAKTTGLKQLQGLVWQAGFESGELKAHVFEDVPPTLRSWRAAGIDLRIYSSGSVHAQRLFFAHTVAGNLLGLLSGHYDTTTGPKREASSYAAIAEDWGRSPREVLFLSDVLEELDAAAEAGMQTTLVVRPGNGPVATGHSHRVATRLDSLPHATAPPA